MNAGDTYFIPDCDKHLWVVISEPSYDRNNLVVVMFTSWKPYCDQACILDVGDHPFIKHRTCVEYHRGTIETDASLERLKQQRRLIAKEPFAPEVLRRIRESAALADMRNDCLDILRCQGLID